MSALRAPLPLKLVGANAASLTIAAMALSWASHGWWLTTGLLGAVFVHGGLGVLALRPQRELEEVAQRVWRGDIDARVEADPIADHDVRRLGAAFNLLLDRLGAERARLRQLTAEVIRVSDRERAVLARELHESTAQRLAAIALQIGAMCRDAEKRGDSACAEQIADLRAELGGVLEEVRALAQMAHPSALDDLGLPTALRQLARETERRADGLTVEVDVAREDLRVAAPEGAVLYRVAQEALANAVKHADARTVRVFLDGHRGRVQLRVTDDGRGFDLAEAERRRPGMGLFTMAERVGIVGGRFEARSAPGKGTEILAVVPRSPEA